MAAGDDLTVARRVHIRALERAVRVRLDLLGVLDNIARAERALEAGKRKALLKSLSGARGTLQRLGGEGMNARIDDETRYISVDAPGNFRFVGMWRPPVLPASPQALSCVAIVCTCLEELNDDVQIRQHWELGCYDLPEFKTEPPMSDEDLALLKELESLDDE